MIYIDFAFGTTGSVLATQNPATDKEVYAQAYSALGDGGGGYFVWRTNAELGPDAIVNNGIWFSRNGDTTGLWERQYYSLHGIDVKWFGARDGIDSTVSISNAISYICSSTASKNYNLYLSKGKYLISDPGLLIDISLTSIKRLTIYGDGPESSALQYSGSTNTNITLKIKGAFNTIIEARDFSIIRPASGNLATALCLENVNYSRFANIHLTLHAKGLVLNDVNCSSFNTLLVNYNTIGIESNFLSITPPNLLNFTSCYINSNEVLGVKMENQYGIHSVSFNACNFEANGYLIDGVTPNPSALGAIQCSFEGANGANGINISNCYFERNKGVADVKITNINAAFGTHTFKGNTFNRTNSAAYVTNNILIVGNGQTPTPIYGQSKSKILFEGNGFLPTGSYIPTAARKAIAISYFGSNYSEFDIVDQGNVYKNILERPLFDSRTPQISENTRVFAFGRIAAPATNPPNCYNIAKVEKIVGFNGRYRITFATEANNLRSYLTLITPINVNLIPAVTFELPTYVEISFSNLSGVLTDCSFNLYII